MEPSRTTKVSLGPESDGLVSENIMLEGKEGRGKQDFLG